MNKSKYDKIMSFIEDRIEDTIKTVWWGTNITSQEIL